MTWGQKAVALVGLLLAMIGVLITFLPYDVAGPQPQQFTLSQLQAQAKQDPFGLVRVEGAVAQFACQPPIVQVSHESRSDKDYACYADSERRVEEGGVLVLVAALGALAAVAILRPSRLGFVNG